MFGMTLFVVHLSLKYIMYIDWMRDKFGFAQFIVHAPYNIHIWKEKSKIFIWPEPETFSNGFSLDSKCLKQCYYFTVELIVDAGCQHLVSISKLCPQVVYFKYKCTPMLSF